MSNKLLTPKMISNTEPSGNVVSCSSRYNSNYEPFYAFDRIYGDDKYTWATTEAVPQWIQYKFPFPKIVKKLITVNRNEGNIRAAKTFIFQGSNDGITFDDIAICNITSYAAHYKETFEFPNNNTP